MSYYFLIFALLTIIIPATNHAEIIDLDPSDPDSAHSLYELTHQLITENAARVASVKQNKISLLLQSLMRLEKEKEKEKIRKTEAENNSAALAKKLGQDKNMHTLNTNGRDGFGWLALGSAALGAILKGASMYVSPTTATDYLDDPSSMAFLLTIPFTAVVGATHYLKIRYEYSITDLEQKIDTQESNRTSAEHRIFDLDTEIQKLQTQIAQVQSESKDILPKDTFYQTLVDFKKNL